MGLPEDDPADERYLLDQAYEEIRQLKAKNETLMAACKLWDEGFTEGEELNDVQFLAWVNANRRAAREAIAKATNEPQRTP
jgi:hypothetical protein